MFNFIIKRFKLSELRQPELICFDHLYSDYLSIKPEVQNEDEKKFVEALVTRAERVSKIRGKRDQVEEPAIWSELYYFALIIANYLPIEKLRTKIMRLRLDYLAIAGKRRYDDYLASKPPDLQSPPIPSEPPETRQQYEQALRDDLRDLLDRIYLEYSILPVRETRLTDLTWLAAKLCLFSLCILLIILSTLFLIPLVKEMNDAYHGDPGGWLAMLNVIRSSANLSALTVFVVVVTGAMGGFVSALQRIQSPPAEGDSLYNLSLLFHGSKSVFIAPISGSIFAIVLYLMFTSGILSGTFFPTIYSPEGKYTRASRSEENKDASTNTNSSTKANNSTLGNTSSNTNANQPSATPTTEESPTAAPKQSQTITPSPTPITTPTPRPVPEQGINVFDFLARSGPGRGQDYALLIIWCFIAGFAERFVPDALDRLISNENGVKGK